MFEADSGTLSARIVFERDRTGESSATDVPAWDALRPMPLPGKS